MQADERALLGQAVRDALERAPADADRALVELGWSEMLAAEPRDAVDVVFSALGATNSSATVLDDVLVGALGLAPSSELAVLLPPFGTWAPPGATGLTTSRIGRVTELLVVGEDESGLRGVVVPIAAVDVAPVRGVDPDAGLHVVHVDLAAGDAISLAPAAWSAAVAVGRRALAHQVSGACRTMLALAREHAIERVQFGRPIAGFQAVRHRLAEALVAIEALEATLLAAWDEPGPMTAALAKAAAGRTARTVTAHCQQVLAGIGFTTDHPFHRSLKRAMVLDGLFGSADDLVVELGRQLLATRELPTLVEL